MIRIVLALILMFSLVACNSYPTTDVKQGASRPSLVLNGAGDGLLIVDGIDMGEAASFDGKPNALLVEPGRHNVQVVGPNGRVIYQSEIYVSLGEIKVIEVGQ